MEKNKGGRPRTEWKNKTHAVALRFEPKELEKIDRVARDYGITRSVLIRKGIELFMEKEKKERVYELESKKQD